MNPVPNKNGTSLCFPGTSKNTGVFFKERRPGRYLKKWNYLGGYSRWIKIVGQHLGSIVGICWDGYSL